MLFSEQQYPTYTRAVHVAVIYLHAILPNAVEIQKLLLKAQLILSRCHTFT